MEEKEDCVFVFEWFDGLLPRLAPLLKPELFEKPQTPNGDSLQYAKQLHSRKESIGDGKSNK
jgi:hypothetical protein